MIGARTRGSTGAQRRVGNLSGAGRRGVPIHTPLFVGVTISTLLVVCGVGALMLGEQLLAVAAAALGVGLILGVVMARVLAFQIMDKPLEEIAQSIETIAAQDVLALVDEFASLAEGEPPKRLEVHARPIDPPLEPTVRRVAQAVNSMISRLQSGAYQFHAASAEPCRRLFYVGADDYLLGCMAAEVMGGLLPNGGQVVLASPHFPHAGVELRRRGFEATIRDRFANVELVGVLGSVYAPSERTHISAMFPRSLRANKQLAGVYCTEAYGTIGAMDAFAGTPMAGRVAIVGHDILNRSVQGLQTGLVSALISQDPFGQGHDAMIHLFNAVAHGWRPAETRLITRSDVVTRENYEEFWRPYEGPVERAALRDHRARALGPAHRPLKLAMVGIEDASFWGQVRHGVEEAAAELESCNASVEWISPVVDNQFMVNPVAEIVERLVSEQYDGLAMPIFDPSLIPCLNRAIASGVTVITVNSEASSLQGLVTTLSKERRRLEIAAGTLEAAARHDPLTGAYNRLVMDADLGEAERIAESMRKPSAVIMLDIDHFKAYNDMLGHTAGDEVLRMVARRIQAEVRPADRVYRYGGEEFLVLLRDTGLDEGQRVAARICDGIVSLGLPHEKNPPWAVVTVSAGVSAIVAGAAWPAVVDAADAALYRSKSSGRNTVATGTPEVGERARS